MRRDDDLSWPLRRGARLHGSSPAVIAGGRTVTYAELSRRVGALGAALDGLGLARGDRVGVLADNSLAHLECWLGVPAFDRVLVDLNFRLAPAELAFMIDDAGVRVLVVDAAQLEVGRALRDRCSSMRHLVFDGTESAPDDCGAYEALLATPHPGSQVLPEELIAFCRDRIAGYKIPRSIDIRDEGLPKSGAGKVLKSKLRDPYWAQRERRVG